MRPLPLLLLVACGPRVDWVDAWGPTSAACDFGVSGEEAGHVDYDVPFYPSEACVDRVLADFEVDEASFRAADDLDNLYGAVRGDELGGARISLVLASARALLTLDYGGWEAVTPSALVTEDFVAILAEVREATGAPTPAAALYDFAASAITSTTALTEDGGRASLGGDGALVVRTGLDDGWAPGVVIVHEARHRWQSHGTCPWNPQGSCDPDATGAHGFGMSALVLLYPQVSDPDFRAYLQARIDTQMRHILTFTDEEGALTAEAREEQERVFGG